MSTRNPHDILKELDKTLSEIKWLGPPSDTSHLAAKEHIDRFQQLGNYEQVISKWIVDKILEMIVSLPSTSSTGFRLCSIGCEDGSLDRIILSSLSKALPQIEFHYTGIEMDDQVCELVEEKLKGLSPNVHVNVVAEDYEELGSQFEPFDLVLMVNCTYYASSLDPMLNGAVRLLKPSGELVIVSSSRQSIDELITRFWSHQRTHDLHTTENVTKALSRLEINHKVFKVPVKFDLTTCFEVKFESPESLLILDHLVFTRLKDYAPEVSTLCVEFLESIASKEGQKCVITSISDMIVVNRNK